MVQINLQLPNDVAESLGKTLEAAERQVLESVALEGYRSRRLSRGQVREMLGLSWFETEEFLASNDCHRHYSSEDLDNDRGVMAAKV